MEVGILITYWGYSYLFFGAAKLPLWYDLWVHLIMPITVLVDFALTKILVDSKDWKKLVVIQVAYFITLFFSTEFGKEIYPNITFDNMATVYLTSVLLLSDWLSFGIGILISRKKVKSVENPEIQISLQEMEIGGTTAMTEGKLDKDITSTEP
jgi:hypothetical protein